MFGEAHYLPLWSTDICRPINGTLSFFYFSTSDERHKAGTLLFLDKVLHARDNFTIGRRGMISTFCWSFHGGTVLVYFQSTNGCFLKKFVYLKNIKIIFLFYFILNLFLILTHQNNLKIKIKIKNKLKLSPKHYIMVIVMVYTLFPCICYVWKAPMQDIFYILTCDLLIRKIKSI